MIFYDKMHENHKITLTTRQMRKWKSVVNYNNEENVQNPPQKENNLHMHK